VPPARAIRGRKDFNLGSELTVGHKVGLITGVEIPSDGLHRRDTSLRNVEDLLHERGAEISHETVRFWWHRFGPISPPRSASAASRA
jgi:hypothetical protein